MTKHEKTRAPSDKDLVLNPMIGGSKGVTMSGASVEELEDLAGENTIEGDVENDTTPQGGVEKVKRAGPPARDGRTQKPRHPQLQGAKTHEQQMRMLERKDDVPDRRRIEEALSRPPDETRLRQPDAKARASEFAISRGGLNQESDHNKHNRPGPAGRKLPKTSPAQQKR